MISSVSETQQGWALIVQLRESQAGPEVGTWVAGGDRLPLNMEAGPQGDRNTEIHTPM